MSSEGKWSISNLVAAMISYTAYFLCFSYKPEKKKTIFPVCFLSGNYYTALHRLVCNVFKSIICLRFQEVALEIISFHFITSSFLLEA